MKTTTTKKAVLFALMAVLAVVAVASVVTTIADSSHQAFASGKNNQSGSGHSGGTVSPYMFGVEALFR